MSSAPWYAAAGDTPLGHQKNWKGAGPREESVWAARVRKTFQATKFRKGACENCGSMTHKSAEVGPVGCTACGASTGGAHVARLSAERDARGPSHRSAWSVLARSVPSGRARTSLPTRRWRTRGGSRTTRSATGTAAMTPRTTSRRWRDSNAYRSCSRRRSSRSSWRQGGVCFGRRLLACLAWRCCDTRGAVSPSGGESDSGGGGAEGGGGSAGGREGGRQAGGHGGVCQSGEASAAGGRGGQRGDG